mmetsp:Transcript_24380/g.55623  ORF Transcript_24380/g.55623 Transcript_24380/m.55623 type:complete len:142 (+) Transcript_24380:34-459(+)
MLSLLRRSRSQPAPLTAPFSALIEQKEAQRAALLRRLRRTRSTASGPLDCNFLEQDHVIHYQKVVEQLAVEIERLKRQQEQEPVLSVPSDTGLADGCCLAGLKRSWSRGSIPIVRSSSGTFWDMLRRFSDSKRQAQAASAA